MSFPDYRYYMQQPTYGQLPQTINPSHLHQPQTTYLPSPSQIRHPQCPPPPQKPQEQTQGQNRTNNPNKHVYLCLYDNCAFRRKADLQRHVAITHNRESLVLFDCQHAGCHRRGDYGFTRKDKMVDHMRDVHGALIPKRVSGSSKEGSAASSPTEG